MKTKLLLTFCLTAILLLTNQSYAQVNTSIEKKPYRMLPTNEKVADKIIYALCSDEIDGRVYVKRGTEVRSYLKLPAKQYKGCKITDIRVGFSYEVGKDSYAFITKDLESEPIKQQYWQCDTVKIPEEGYIGWIKIPFDEPYIIDSDEDLYIGLYSIEVDGFGLFAIDGRSPYPLANLINYRRPGESDWLYREAGSNISIKIGIEGENIPQNHIRANYSSVDKMYYTVGETAAVKSFILNEGTRTVSSFDITWQMNGGEKISKHIDDINLQPFNHYTVSMNIPVVAEGLGKLDVTVSNPNGKEDDFIGNTTTTTGGFGALLEPYQRNVLVDELVNTSDENTPTGNEIIRKAIEKSPLKDHIIWIQNHVMDEDYHILGFSSYDWLFDDNLPLTPSVNLNHIEGIPDTWVYNTDMEKVAAPLDMFMVDEDFDKHLDYVLQMKTFYSLSAECKEVEDNVLKIKVEAKPALKGLFPYIFKPAYALLLTEDGIIGSQAGVEGDYIHNGVPRVFINPDNPEYAKLGNEIDIPADGFTIETEYTVTDPSWKLENMKLIFYIMDAQMVIDNVVSCPIETINSGLEKNVSDADFTVICKNGNLHIEGDFDNAKIFAIDGQELMTTNSTDTNISGLNKGIYCIFIQKENRFASYKFVVQ